MSSIHDWDFLIGDWRVRHRRLRKRLANGDEWDEFEGTCSMRKVLGGAGNVDDNALEFPGGAYGAVTLRAYDAASETWSIWWLDSRTPTQLDPPLVGRFENGVGIFYADHVFERTPIRVRFCWTGLSSGTPRWEQAFSADGGNTWEVNWTMDFMKQRQACCPIVELRQYTLHPGMRDRLIELFEREFIESQEQVGIQIIGTFRDLDNPDRFVWLRGFQDMASRADHLGAFYGGPIWKAHRDAANVTMIDSDNVLLLRPAGTGGFDLTNAVRPAPGACETSANIIVAVIYHLKPNSEPAFADKFAKSIAPILCERGVKVLAQLVSEHHLNTFPRLPVREDASVFIWFTSVPDREGASALPLNEIAPHLRDHVTADPEVLLLEPTARSLLRH